MTPWRPWSPHGADAEEAIVAAAAQQLLINLVYSMSARWVEVQAEQEMAADCSQVGTMEGRERERGTQGRWLLPSDAPRACTCSRRRRRPRTEYPHPRARTVHVPPPDETRRDRTCVAAHRAGGLAGNVSDTLSSVVQGPPSAGLRGDASTTAAVRAVVPPQSQLLLHTTCCPACRQRQNRAAAAPVRTTNPHAQEDSRPARLTESPSRPTSCPTPHLCHQDATLAAPLLPSSTALVELVSHTLGALSFQEGLRRGWADAALDWALHAKSRHLACRSMQVGENPWGRVARCRGAASPSCGGREKAARRRQRC